MLAAAAPHIPRGPQVRPPFLEVQLAQLTSSPPAGWVTGKPSEHTRPLAAGRGGERRGDGSGHRGSPQPVATLTQQGHPAKQPTGTHAPWTWDTHAPRVRVLPALAPAWNPTTRPRQQGDRLERTGVGAALTTPTAPPRPHACASPQLTPLGPPQDQEVSAKKCTAAAAGPGDSPRARGGHWTPAMTMGHPQGLAVTLHPSAT